MGYILAKETAAYFLRKFLAECPGKVDATNPVVAGIHLNPGTTMGG